MKEVSTKYYNTNELEELALEAIEARGLVFVNEVAAYLPCTRATFYNHGLDKLDTIKNALYRNREADKADLRRLMKASPAGQIALYRLLGTEEEYNRLTNNTKIINQNNQNNVINRDFEGLLKSVAKSSEYIEPIRDEPDEPKYLDE